MDSQGRPPNASHAGAKTSAMKPTVPMEVHSMAPVVVYAGFFGGATQYTQGTVKLKKS